MTRWLVQLSFGPAQSFISAARRSRDLWAGSRILSEIVRGGAQALMASANGPDRNTLIYPVASQVCTSSESKAESSGNLSNEILAIVHAEDVDALRRIIEDAQQAGREALDVIAMQEMQRWQSALPQGELRDDFWNAQVPQTFTFSAAWARLDNDDDYPRCVKAVKRMMAARKASATFRPHPCPAGLAHEGLPKSSLDGVNESVLPEPDKRGRATRRFDVGEGEQLDALGCIKRSFGKQEIFTALPRLAAHPWLEAIGPQRRKSLSEAYVLLHGHDIATRCDGNAGTYASFPYDADLLFGGALERAIADAKRDDNADLQNALAELGKRLNSIDTRPNPYVALLYADGDRMGRFLGVAKTVGQHSRISQAIAAFSDDVPGVARNNGAHAIYNGGDDVMVACPLPGAIACGRDLAEAFARHMQTLALDLAKEGLHVPPDDIPTLRVGIAIGHIMEPMNFLRHNAKQAELLAKHGTDGTGSGNALGICLHLRSGPVISARLSFETAGEPFGDFSIMKHWMDAYVGEKRELPARTAFEMLEAADRLKALGDAHDPDRRTDDLQRLCEAEFKRIVLRSRESGGDRTIADSLKKDLVERWAVLKHSHPDAPIAALHRLGSELILARWLSAASNDLLPERGGRA
jgi:CRISPR-associated protein Cmr2